MWTHILKYTKLALQILPMAIQIIKYWKEVKQLVGDKSKEKKLAKNKG